MSSESGTKKFLLALSLCGVVSALTACGGSSSNVSPGNIVIPPDGPTDPTDPNEPVQPPPSGGDEIASIIPGNLSDCIFDSGDTAGGKPVYVISVTCLPGGVLDTSGLLLGNDFIYRIEGGALRIAQN
jgi:hypothetical protein